MMSDQVERKHKPLSEMHRRFCREYVGLANGAAAARAAGFKPSNAKGQALTLLGRSDIQLEIKRIRDEMLPLMEEKCRVSLQALLMECQEAWEIARRHSSASGMIASTALKARLCGLDGSLKIEDVVARDRLQAELAQHGELRKAGTLIREASVSLGLAPDATPVEVAAAIAERSVVSPEAYNLLACEVDSEQHH
jgi:phage terminase small subunit